MKKFLFVILIIICFNFSSCSLSEVNRQNNSGTPVENEAANDTSNEETKEGDRNFVMKIDETLVDIIWENNNSVKELMEYAKNGLTIKMHMYGGFEQVGSIGKTITSNNSQITTNPGDVVLYSSNQIVIFFGSNSWSYTKLGHINLSQSELSNLLNKNSVLLKLQEE